MGAIARQVAQVKRKNSTNCRPPDARLTVLGSVASRFGPREVAIGRGAEGASSVGAATTSVELDGCSSAFRIGVAVGSAATGGCTGDSGEMAAGAQAANRRMSRPRLGKRQFFIVTYSF